MSSYHGLSTVSLRRRAKNGSDGKGIQTVVRWYYLSTSNTVLQDGSWGTSTPTRTTGTWIWYKDITTYSDGSTSETTAVCSTGDTGSKGDKGDTGAGGIPWGVFDDTVEYKIQNGISPIVLDGTLYYLLIKDVAAGGARPSADPVHWQLISHYLYAIYQMIIADFGKVASAVFKGHYMFSQQGVDASGNATSDYSGFTDENGTAFQPNILMNFLTGLSRSRKGEFIDCKAVNMNITGDSKFDGIVKLSSSFTGSITGANIYYLPAITSDQSIYVYGGTDQIGKVIRFFNSSALGNAYVYKIYLSSFSVTNGSTNQSYPINAIVRPQETLEITCLKTSESGTTVTGLWQITSRFAQTDFVNFADTMRNKTLGRFPLVLGIGRISGISSGVTLTGTWWDGRNITTIFPSVSRESEGTYYISTGLYSSGRLTEGYVVLATGFGTLTGVGPIKATVTAKNTEGFRIVLSDDESPNDGSCEFVIFGANWNYNLT